MQNYNRTSFSSHLFLFGLFVLAISLPWSKFLMSVSQIILLLAFFISGNISEKIKLFLKNKTAVIISSVFVLHLIGLIYTSEFNYGMEDIRKKIPLLLLPFLFSTAPSLDKKTFERLLLMFVLSVIAASVVCAYVLLGFTQKLILQPKDASIFISHIRFSLLMSFSIFILGYYSYEKKNWSFGILSVLMSCWLIAIMIMLECETGLICTGVVFIFLLLRAALLSKKLWLKISVGACLLLISLSFLKFFSLLTTEYNSIPQRTFLSTTKKGNAYTSDTVNAEIENRNFVWQNVCEKELSEEWNKKSLLNYNGKDLKGNEIRYTLIRFLTSKNMAKDAEGISALSPEEISAIEKGIPNVNYMGIFNPAARLHVIAWEFNKYFRGGNPSGHSVIQRLEFWKAAKEIIKKNFWVGVGTGDVETAFAEQYDKMKSPLTSEWRLRSHNQFLAIGTAFGSIGLIWFLISLFYPLTIKQNRSNYFYIVFFIIAFLSMLTEDTLESQAGVTFFAFFNSLFLFLQKHE